MLRVVFWMATLLFEYFSCSVLFPDGFGGSPVFCCAFQVVFRFIVCPVLFVLEFQKMYVVFYLYCTCMIWLEFKANDPCTISRCSGWHDEGSMVRYTEIEVLGRHVCSLWCLSLEDLIWRPGLDPHFFWFYLFTNG